MASQQFDEFLIAQLQHLDQRGLWTAFQRLLRVTRADCWDAKLRQELIQLSPEEITPPRNHFLYQAHYWPLEDLVSDAALADFIGIVGEKLDIDERGFLLRLSLSVYRLFEQLITDLGNYTEVIRDQMNAARYQSGSENPELDCYRSFLEQIEGK